LIRRNMDQRCYGLATGNGSRVTQPRLGGRSEEFLPAIDLNFVCQDLLDAEGAVVREAEIQLAMIVDGALAGYIVFPLRGR